MIYIFYYIDSNGQLSVTSDEIDKIRSEKNQGKIQIGQWCYEINVGPAAEPPTLTDHGRILKNYFLLLFPFLQLHREIRL